MVSFTSNIPPNDLRNLFVASILGPWQVFARGSAMESVAEQG